MDYYGGVRLAVRMHLREPWLNSQNGAWLLRVLRCRLDPGGFGTRLQSTIGAVANGAVRYDR